MRGFNSRPGLKHARYALRDLKAAARRREAGPRKFLARNYVWPIPAQASLGVLYLRAMISDTDITKLKKVFATKGELAAVKDELGDVKIELGEVHDKVDIIMNKIDALAGSIQELRIENTAGSVTLARHTRQIEALSKGTGVKIPQ